MEYLEEYEQASGNMDLLFGVATKDINLRTKIYRAVYLLKDEYYLVVFTTKMGIVVKCRNKTEILENKFNELIKQENKIFIPYNTISLIEDKVEAMNKYLYMFIESEDLDNSVISMKNNETVVLFMINNENKDIDEEKYQQMWGQFMNIGGVERELKVSIIQFVRIINKIKWKYRKKYKVEGDYIIINFWTHTLQEYNEIKEKCQEYKDDKNDDYKIIELKDEIVDYLAGFGVLKLYDSKCEYIYPLEGTNKVIIDNSSINEFIIKEKLDKININEEGIEIYTQLEYKNMNNLQKYGLYYINNVGYSFLDLVQHIYNGNRKNPYTREDIDKETVLNIISEYFKYSGNSYLYGYPTTNEIPDYTLTQDFLIRFNLNYYNKTNTIWTIPITCNIDKKELAITTFSSKWTSGDLFRANFCHPMEIMLVFKDTVYGFFKKCSVIWPVNEDEQDKRLCREIITLSKL